MTILQPAGPQKIVFRGQLLEVVQQEMTDGSSSVRFEFARRSPGTRVMFVRESQILLTEEFRYERNGFDFRLPGGKVFDSLTAYEDALANGIDLYEAARKAAINESREEVGLVPSRLELICKSICGATIHWDLYYFVCRDWKQEAHGQRLDRGEAITSNWFSFKDAYEMCIKGTISEERSALNILRMIGQNPL